MVKEDFIPVKGDIIKLSFDPQSGHEQNGWRPGLVISNYTFNNATGFALVCPITNTNRDYPFHILLPEGFEITGVVMVDQVKSLDFIERNARYSTNVPKGFMSEVMAIHAAIFQDD
ncbi:MAG: type II toxin-antitoxin system PemK/MazF family toxin [Spirochaetia bacterium]|jgi:mRNA interferase MazF|nr:type II toxin-antitoxin system PemK/MazF family toxin [Spirochaetia bacterium]